MTHEDQALARFPPVQSGSTETVSQFVQRKGTQFDSLAANFELRCWLYSLGLLRSVRKRTAQMAVTPSLGSRSSVLDLCCGTGGITRELQKLFQTVHGVDLSARMLSVAARRCPGAHLVHGEAASVPISGGRFDACVMGLCFHEMPAHLREPLLARAADAVHPQGRLVISDYAWPAATWLRGLVRRFAPTLIEPDVLEFLDWPLDDVLGGLQFTLVEEQRLYGGILRLTAWSRAAAR